MTESASPIVPAAGADLPASSPIEAVQEPDDTGPDLRTPRVPTRRGILAAVDRPLVAAFTATLGVLGALVLGSAIGSIATILVYIFLALFVALGLDPIVRRIERSGVKRGTGIAIVFIGFAVLVALLLIFVMPPVLAQIGEFIVSIPTAMAEFVESDFFHGLNEDIQLALGSARDQLSESLASPETIAAISGGALAIGIGIASFISASFIVVALTLYFLASLTSMKQALYALAPARNRPTLSSMTERITASVGNSLIGQAEMVVRASA